MLVTDDMTVWYQGAIRYEGFGGQPVIKHWWRESDTCRFASSLDPRYDLKNHSPDGFNWGYLGSGPSQLALALLADALADDQRALRLYLEFKFRVVARWPQGGRWTMSADAIRQYADTIEEEDKKYNIARK